jgi:hypothetical protein
MSIDLKIRLITRIIYRIFQNNLLVFENILHFKGSVLLAIPKTRIHQQLKQERNPIQSQTRVSFLTEYG